MVLVWGMVCDVFRWFLAWSADGWAALGSFLAVAVALAVPPAAARKEAKRQTRLRTEEWARQDQLRLEDKAREEKRIADEKADEEARSRSVHQEVCSAVDRIVVYYDALRSIQNAEPDYMALDQVVLRIKMQTSVLRQMLEILEKRPELSDGALFSAVGGRAVAELVERHATLLMNDLSEHLMSEIKWVNHRVFMSFNDSFVDSVQDRSDAVRKWRSIGQLNDEGKFEGTKGKALKAKYKRIINMMDDENATDQDVVNAIKAGEG